VKSESGFTRDELAQSRRLELQFGPSTSP
jgi:hypothetical protein